MGWLIIRYHSFKYLTEYPVLFPVELELDALLLEVKYPLGNAVPGLGSLREGESLGDGQDLPGGPLLILVIRRPELLVRNPKTDKHGDQTVLSADISVLDF